MGISTSDKKFAALCSLAASGYSYNYDSMYRFLSSAAPKTETRRVEVYDKMIEKMEQDNKLLKEECAMDMSHLPIEALRALAKKTI